MKKLYYDSPYIKEFEAMVVSCEKGKKGYEVVLDQTAFYPEGGGQPTDTGVLGGVKVLEVQKLPEALTGRIVLSICRNTPESILCPD